MADWTPPPPGAWAPPGGFTPIPGMAPNPKLPLEVQGAGLSNAAAAAKLPFVAPQSAADAAKAQVDATVGQKTLPFVIRKAAADAQNAERNANKSGADAGVSAQQLKDYFVGKRQMEDNARTLLGSIINNEVQAQQPHTTGSWQRVMSSWPVNGTVGYDSTNQGMLSHGMDSTKAAMAALNTQVANLAKAPGSGAGSSAGMMIRNLQEFLAQSAAAGQVNPAADRPTTMGTMENYEKIVRTLLARQSGIDPSKVDVMKLPLGRLGINHLKFTAPLSVGSPLYSRLAPPGVNQPKSTPGAAAAPPAPRVLNYHELAP